MVAHLSFNHIRQRFAFVRTPLKYFFSGSSNVHDSFTLASLQNDSIDIDNQSGAIAEYETGEEPLLGLFETYFVSYFADMPLTSIPTSRRLCTMQLPFYHRADYFHDTSHFSLRPSTIIRQGKRSTVIANL